MNINNFVAVIARMVADRLMNWGIRRMNAPKPGARRTPQQQSHEKAMRQAVKRARQAARITRRMQ